MQFTIAYYTNLTPFNSRKIPIGVILQTPENVLFRFDLSDERFNKIKEISQGADPETFYKFEESFQKNYIDVDKINITDDNGQKIDITATDSRFLPYLNTTFQNYYQFSKPTPIEIQKPQEFIEYLFKELITSQPI